MSADPFVDYTKFDATKLSCHPAERKSVEIGKDKIEYRLLKYKYNYGTNEAPHWDAFCLQGPELESSMGITKKAKKDSDTRFDYSIGAPLTQSKPELKHFTNVLNEIHVASALLLEAHSESVGLVDDNKFEAKNAVKMGFRSPVYYFKDKSTKRLIEGRDPAIFSKLFKNNYDGVESSTIITDLDAKRVDWNNLTAVKMSFVPLYNFKAIFVGVQKSIQVKLKSAFLTKPVKARNNETDQAESIKQYKSSMDAGMQESISASLAKLSLDRKGLNLLDAPVKPSETKSDNKGATEAPKLASPTNNAPSQAPNIQQNGYNQPMGYPPNNGYGHPMPSGYAMPGNQPNYGMPPGGYNAPNGYAPQASMVNGVNLTGMQQPLKL